VPIGGTVQVTAMYTDDTPTGSGSAVLTASPAVGSFTSASVSPNNGETVTPAGATVTVTEDADTVAASKTVVATFQCSIPGATTFNIAHGGTISPQSVTLICGDGSNLYNYNYYGGYPYGTGAYPYTQYPYNNTTTYTTAMGLTVTASPASVSCTSPSSISVLVKDQLGNIAPNGTSVTVSASTGTVNPNVISTSGGYATTTFIAPDNSNGTATVTATSGTGTGYATVAFSCTSPSAVTVPATTYQPPVAPPSYYPSGPVTIAPPNTGDAGLAQSSNSTTTTGIALVAMSVVGLAGAGVWTLRHQRTER
jgi:hypothetical protein